MLFVARHNAVLGENLARHVFGDLFVILKLAFIARKERAPAMLRMLALPPRVRSSRIMTG